MRHLCDATSSSPSIAACHVLYVCLAWKVPTVHFTKLDHWHWWLNMVLCYLWNKESARWHWLLLWISYLTLPRQACCLHLDTTTYMGFISQWILTWQGMWCHCPGSIQSVTSHHWQTSMQTSSRCKQNTRKQVSIHHCSKWDGSWTGDQTGHEGVPHEAQ